MKILSIQRGEDEGTSLAHVRDNGAVINTRRHYLQ